MRIGPGTQAVDLLWERPASVQPGLYAASSATPAYSLLRAMIAARDADLLGEHYAYSNTPQGWAKLTTAGVRRAIGRRDMPMRVAANPVIGMGPESFVRELEAYRNWEVKWWREVIQNSVDAGASRIDLHAKEQDDGTWLVSCRDNGGGMPEQVLVTKFLYLGATTKAGAEGKAGGFGVAKKLILLPWLLWEVITGNTHVVGHGVSYYRTDDFSPEAEAFFEEVGGRPEAETRKGTEVRVRMPADKCTDNVAALAFLEKCDLPGIRFTINGKKVRASLRAQKLVESVPGKADVYFTKKKGQKTRHLIVRSNGLYMFNKWIEEVEGILIAEITAPSIQILTANRDGFRDWEVERAISGLANRIAVDRKSALRAKKGIIRKKYKGEGKFKTAVQDRMQVEALSSAGNLTPSKKGKIDPEAFKAILEALKHGAPVGRTEQDTLHGGPQLELAPGQNAALNEVLGPNLGTSSEILKTTTFGGVDHVEGAIKQLTWQPDFYVYNNNEGFRVPKKFFPETMTPTIFKLAKVWTEICRYVLIQLGCPLPFGVGWIFQEETGAAYQGESEEEDYFKTGGEHWLLLNPFRNTRSHTKVLRPTNHKDLKWIYAAAIHEATHMADGLAHHNESFAAALTRNMAKCADGYKHIRKLAASIKMSGAIKLERPPSTDRPRNPLDKLTRKTLLEHMCLTEDCLGAEAETYKRFTKGELLDFAWENGQIADIWFMELKERPVPSGSELYEMAKAIP